MCELFNQQHGVRAGSTHSDTARQGALCAQRSAAANGAAAAVSIRSRGGCSSPAPESFVSAGLGSCSGRHWQTKPLPRIVEKGAITFSKASRALACLGRASNRLQARRGSKLGNARQAARWKSITKRSLHRRRRSILRWVVVVRRLDHAQGWRGWLGATAAPPTRVADPRRPPAHPRLPLHPFPRLQAYAANYSGHAKIDRLLFVADRSTGQPLELEALKLAADALKRVGGCCGCSCGRAGGQRAGGQVAGSPVLQAGKHQLPQLSVHARLPTQAAHPLPPCLLHLPAD